MNRVTLQKMALPAACGEGGLIQIGVLSKSIRIGQTWCQPLNPCIKQVLGVHRWMQMSL